MWTEGNAYRRPISDIATSVKPDLSFDKSVFKLEQNFPNPVKNTTTIKYKMNQSEKVELTVFDIFGKELVSLVNSIQTAGEYEITFNAKNLNSGTYFYRLNSAGKSQTRKFMVFK